MQWSGEDIDKAAHVMHQHISMRLDRITAAVRKGYPNIHIARVAMRCLIVRLPLENTEMKVTGGKPLYGASVGILMLDARFPRIPGDMGNALSWPFPVHYRIVRNASPDRVVRRGAEGLLDIFIAAARDLVADGVDGITTNCGFLSLFQRELAESVSVPVATSSLMQVDLVNRLLPPGKRAGILTISASSLTAEHLAKAHVPADTPVGSTEGMREFTRAILDNELELDVGLARADNIEAALALQATNPDLGAIVLECTNMVPYAADIRAATGLPVFSIHTFVTWFQAGLVPPRFALPDAS